MSLSHNAIIVVFSSLVMFACAPTRAQHIEPQNPTAIAEHSNRIAPIATKEHAIHATDDGNENADISNEYQCQVPSASSALVDRVRSSTQTRLCNTVGWVDSWFGDDKEFDGKGFSSKVSIGYRHDEVDGLDPRLRVRIRTKLPNVSERFNAFIGRVEEDSFISNTEVDGDSLSNVGLRSTDDDDSEWLIGLGYRKPSNESNGWDYSVGAKLSGGLSPYAKTAHRYLFQTAENQFWHTTQTIFWQKEDGFGVSSNLDYTYVVGQRDILESNASVKYTEEAEQLEWFASTSWHHSLSRTVGISSSAYVRGEEKNDASIPEFGTTFTYRQPFLRDWLFVEAGVDFRWERELRREIYNNAVRFSLQFEMVMGDFNRRRRHK